MTVTIMIKNSIPSSIMIALCLLFVAPTVAASHPQHHQYVRLGGGGGFYGKHSRLLDATTAVSEECKNETLALYENSQELETAFLSMELDVMEADEEGGAVSCSSSEGEEMGTTCSFDFAALPSAPEYESTCASAGGEMMVGGGMEEESESPTKMSCEKSAGTSFSFTYMNTMHCVAPSCKVENMKTQVDEEIKESQATIEARTGATCSYESASDGGEGEIDAQDTGSGDEGRSGGAKFGIAVLVLLIVGVIAFCIYKQYKSSQEDEQAADAKKDDDGWTTRKVGVPPRGKLGVRLGTCPEGAVFTSIKPDSPLEAVGVEAGDIILMVNGYSAKGKSSTDVVTMLAEAGKSGNGQQRILTMKCQTRSGGSDSSKAMERTVAQTTTSGSYHVAVPEEEDEIKV